MEDKQQAEVQAKEKRARAAFYAKANRERAAYIRGILGHGTRHRTAEEFETALVDLLSDARHFCDAKGLDYASCDKAAYLHYAAERDQARTGIDQ